MPIQITAQGFFDLSDWGTVEIQGPDAKDYLQRMSTIDFRCLTPGHIRHGAFLTARGTVVGLGMIQVLSDDRFHFVSSPGQSMHISEHLEQFHFGEKLVISDISDQVTYRGLWNYKLDATPLTSIDSKIDDIPVTLWRDDCRPLLIWLKVKRALSHELWKGGLLPLELFHYYRIESGVPQVGIEVSEKEIILELNFDRAVARDKGCYPGQEVVERIFTYGSVNRKLLLVKMDLTNETTTFSPPVDLTLDGKLVGQWVSLAKVPSHPHSAIGLAFIHRSYWEEEREFQTALGFPVKIR